jgi:hypothetical protein
MAGLGEHGLPTSNVVFGPSPQDPRARFRTMPTDLDDLELAGLDPRSLTEGAQWGPLPLRHRVVN